MATETTRFFIGPGVGGFENQSSTNVASKTSLLEVWAVGFPPASSSTSERYIPQ